jgi:hypothetical protein
LKHERTFFFSNTQLTALLLLRKPEDRGGYIIRKKRREILFELKVGRPECGADHRFILDFIQHVG